MKSISHSQYAVRLTIQLPKWIHLHFTRWIDFVEDSRCLFIANLVRCTDVSLNVLGESELEQLLRTPDVEAISEAT